MTTPAIPAHDAERLEVVKHNLVGRFDALAIDNGVDFAYRLGAASRPSPLAKILATLTELDATIGAWRLDGDVVHITVTTAEGQSRTREAGDFVEALRLCALAVAEMREGAAMLASKGGR